MVLWCFHLCYCLKTLLKQNLNIWNVELKYQVIIHPTQKKILSSIWKADKTARCLSSLILSFHFEPIIEKLHFEATQKRKMVTSKVFQTTKRTTHQASDFRLNIFKFMHNDALENCFVAELLCLRCCRFEFAMNSDWTVARSTSSPFFPPFIVSWLVWIISPLDVVYALFGSEWFAWFLCFCVSGWGTSVDLMRQRWSHGICLV